MRFTLTALFLTLLSACHPATAQSDDLRLRTQNLITAYANGDKETVLRSIDDQTTIYGSDAAEVFHGPREISTMLSNDQKLWGGHAQIGPMTDITVHKSGVVESIFFNASFRVGDRAPMPVRFCMVWIKEKGRWLLLQSSNAVVTQGQSGEELLHPHSTK